MPELKSLDKRVDALERKVIDNTAKYNGHWFERSFYVIRDLEHTPLHERLDKRLNSPANIHSKDDIKCAGCGRSLPELNESEYSPECPNPGETPPTVAFIRGREVETKGDIVILIIDYEDPLPAEYMEQWRKDNEQREREYRAKTKATGVIIKDGIPKTPRNAPRNAPRKKPFWYTSTAKTLSIVYRYDDRDERFYKVYADKETRDKYKQLGTVPPPPMMFSSFPALTRKHHKQNKLNYDAWLNRSLEVDPDLAKDSGVYLMYNGQELNEPMTKEELNKKGLL